MKKIRKQAMLFFLLVITFSYAMFQGGFVSWFLFFSFLPFALYAIGIAYYPLKDIKILRVFPKKEYSFGETMEVRVEITRKYPFPLFYLLIEEQLPMKIGGFDSERVVKKMLYPLFKKRMFFSYSINQVKRGEHHFKTFRIKTGDLLGLYEKEHKLSIEDKILVYPPCEDILYHPLHHLFDQGKAITNERIQRDTTMATGVREYRPGDRFSWINWKASARQNEIMVKEFEQRQSDDLFIVLDSMPDTHFEIIISFVASLLKTIIPRGVQTGMLFYQKERIEFPIQGGEAHLQQIFYHLAKIEDHSQVPLDRIVKEDLHLFRKNVMVALITGKLSNALIENVSIYPNGSAVIFLVKTKAESTVESEKEIMKLAMDRGVKVIMIHEHEFKDALKEVSG